MLLINSDVFKFIIGLTVVVMVLLCYLVHIRYFNTKLENFKIPGAIKCKTGFFCPPGSTCDGYKCFYENVPLGGKDASAKCPYRLFCPDRTQCEDNGCSSPQYKTNEIDEFVSDDEE